MIKTASNQKTEERKTQKYKKMDNETLLEHFGQLYGVSVEYGDPNDNPELERMKVEILSRMK